jgi:hypothetical protein
MPDGGHEKFYDATTGIYNWQAHAVEVEYQRDQARGKGEPAPVTIPTTPQAAAEGAPEGDVSNAVAEAGLNWETLAQTLNVHGGLRPELDCGARCA